MPLVNCPVCGRQLSDRAQACPKCGHPLVPVPCYNPNGGSSSPQRNAAPPAGGRT
ncbi:MAG: zinc-ribbon domain-containing protein [Deltaproteobacteria bacterium]|nr:zinc-ribbon domain-containing protein [Deltaproteobacteria bacterium]